MNDEIFLAPSISWQSYDFIDLLFILNRANHNFYYFNGTGKEIIECILKGQEIESIIELCKKKYNVEDQFLQSTIDEFLCLLKQEGIIL